MKSMVFSVLCNEGLVVNKKGISKDLVAKIKKMLSVSPESNFGNFQQKVWPVYREDNENLYLPVYFCKDFLKITPDIISFEEKNKFIINNELKDTISLRKTQEECFSKCIAQIQENEYGGGIVQLETGMGKTVISIKLILKSRLKTIVIVNKIELMKQWAKEILRWCPGVKIGTIQGKNFEVEDCDIVIGMLQTISIRNDITCERLKMFGMCIIDEVHNVSSEVFSKVMLKVRPRYMFGLTATLKRSDGMEKLINWFIGESVYDSSMCGSSKNMKQESLVYSLKYFGESSKAMQLKDGTAAVSSMLTNIGSDKERNELLCKLIKGIIDEDGEERQILVVSDRISQLRYINKKIGTGISGMFIGGMKEEEIVLSKSKQVLLGTYALVSEGFNLPKLNCIVFASPRRNITQAIGRIYRKSHVSLSPLIVDIVDTFSIFTAQGASRKKVYKSSIESCVIFGGNLDSFVYSGMKTKIKKLGVFESDCIFDSETEEVGEVYDFLSDSGSDNELHYSKK
jgi:superfamily II DNA or RNA helicase